MTYWTASSATFSAVLQHFERYTEPGRCTPAERKDNMANEEIKVKVTVQSNFTPTTELDMMMLATEACHSIIENLCVSAQLSVLAVLVERTCVDNGMDVLDAFDTLAGLSKEINEAYPIEAGNE